MQTFVFGSDFIRTLHTEHLISNRLLISRVTQTLDKDEFMKMTIECAISAEDLRHLFDKCISTDSGVPDPDTFRDIWIGFVDAVQAAWDWLARRCKR